MSKEQENTLAQDIATQIIDKSFWGNEWFFFFSILLCALIASFCAWGGSYLATRAQNKAMRVDFDNALKDIKIQTDAVKRIEEDISHNYQEKREILKIKRDKIEEIYLALSEETDLLANNFTIATTNSGRGIAIPSNRVGMLLALYFKEELSREFDYYLGQRKNLISRIRQLCEENYKSQPNADEKRLEYNMVFFSNYTQAKTNIELGLESLMQNLINQDCRTSTPPTA